MNRPAMKLLYSQLRAVLNLADGLDPQVDPSRGGVKPSALSMQSGAL
jgi:hypothetical protein